MKGNSLVLGAGDIGDNAEIFFARFCYRGQRHEELEKEYFLTPSRPRRTRAAYQTVAR